MNTAWSSNIPKLECTCTIEADISEWIDISIHTRVFFFSCIFLGARAYILHILSENTLNYLANKRYISVICSKAAILVFFCHLSLYAHTHIHRKGSVTRGCAGLFPPPPWNPASNITRGVLYQTIDHTLKSSRLRNITETIKPWWYSILLLVRVWTWLQLQLGGWFAFVLHVCMCFTKCGSD